MDAVRLDADHITPDGLGLVVRLVHRHPEPIAIDSEDLGHQLPGERDCLGFEVVTEAEIPQHLEERAVAKRRPDDVDVDRPEALLH